MHVIISSDEDTTTASSSSPAYNFSLQGNITIQDVLDHLQAHPQPVTNIHTLVCGAVGIWVVGQNTNTQLLQTILAKYVTHNANRSPRNHVHPVKNGRDYILMAYSLGAGGECESHSISYTPPQNIGQDPGEDA